MELLQLKYFCDAAESQNFSKTAKKFSVPASNISQSIKRLEREIGAPLFVRHANSIELNDAGREFYSSVSAALSVINEAAVAAGKGKTTEKIKICINSNRRTVMETVEKYRRMYPDVELVTYHTGNPTAEDFDVIIGCENETMRGYDARLMISEKIMLAVRKDNPISKNENLKIESLIDEPFVMMSENSSLYDLSLAICRAHGFSPKIAIQCDDPFYVRKCVELGLGVSFIPDFSWSGQFSADVVLLEAKGYMRNTYVYTNSQKRISECTKAFIDMLLE